jgi:hypothetical protein
LKYARALKPFSVAVVAPLVPVLVLVVLEDVPVLPNVAVTVDGVEDVPPLPSALVCSRLLSCAPVRKCEIYLYKWPPTPLLWPSSRN